LSAPRTIAAAAIRTPDGVVHSLPPPARHHTIIGVLAQRPGHRPADVHDQGFVDDAGEFVDRETAARVAVEAGQIERPNWGSQLYSEDLW